MTPAPVLPDPLREREILDSSMNTGNGAGTHWERQRALAMVKVRTAKKIVTEMKSTNPKEK